MGLRATAVLVCGAVALAGLAAGSRLPVVGTGSGGADAAAVRATAWGVAGGYPSAATFTQLKSADVSFATLELDWALAEPRRNVFNHAYLAGVATHAAAMRNAGLKVVLETGLYDAPAWVMRMPGARYVNQWGQAYTANPVPDLVWDRRLRPYADRYLRTVFSVLGHNFYVVRAGGGHWDELTYPREYVHGRITNAYWAFGAAARASDPVRGWVPGHASRHGEAARFLNWYLNGLAAYQNWQVADIRHYYAGTIAVLYPSWGMRPGDFQKAVADNLDGRSSAEINGEVQGGTDHRRDVFALRDSRVALWSTWADATSADPSNPAPMGELGALAARTHRLLMGENTGAAVTPVTLANLTANANRFGAAAIMWVRYGSLFAPGDASLGDLRIAAASGRFSASQHTPGS